MLLAQISDLHVTTLGAEYQLVDTSATLRRAVDTVNTMSPRPDAVVATGDLVDHGTDDEYKLLFAILGDLEIPLHVLPGNHDNAPLLRMHMHFHGGLRADEPGHLGTVLDQYPVRVVLVDTTDPSRHDGVFPPTRAAWLDRVLRDAPDATHPRRHASPAVRDRHLVDGRHGHRRGRSCTVRAHDPRSPAGGAGDLRSCPPADLAHLGLGHVDRVPEHGASSRAALGPDAPATLTREAPSLQLHQWIGDGFVTHTVAIDPPDGLDISARVADWHAVKQRFARGGPFPKDEQVF